MPLIIITITQSEDTIQINLLLLLNIMDITTIITMVSCVNVEAAMFMVLMAPYW